MEKGDERVAAIETDEELARALGLSLTGLFAELEGEAPEADNR